MKLKKCYFHSLNVNSEKTLELLDEIIRDGSILSLEKSCSNYDVFRMNKKDEICISKKSPFKLFYTSAYNMYVRNRLSFILNEDLSGVYKPELIPIFGTFGDGFRYLDSGLSDMYDEYRVKNEISLDDVIGINIPFTSIVNNLGCYKWFFLSDKDSFNEKRNDSYYERVINTMSFYNSVISILNSNDIYLPIYDLEANIEVKSEFDIEKVKKKGK